jgi:hypothetical protein
MPLLSKLPTKQKLIFLAILGTASFIRIFIWYYYHMQYEGFRIPFIFWEGIILLSLISWNPRGIRLILLVLLGFFISQLIIFNFFVGGMSTLPFWYLFRDVYGLLRLDSLYAFLIESALLLSMTISLFFGKPKLKSELLDSN